MVEPEKPEKPLPTHRKAAKGVTVAEHRKRATAQVLEALEFAFKALDLGPEVVLSKGQLRGQVARLALAYASEKRWRRGFRTRLADALGMTRQRVTGVARAMGLTGEGWTRRDGTQRPNWHPWESPRGKHADPLHLHGKTPSTKKGGSTTLGVTGDEQMGEPNMMSPSRSPKEVMRDFLDFMLDGEDAVEKDTQKGEEADKETKAG